MKSIEGMTDKGGRRRTYVELLAELHRVERENTRLHADLAKLSDSAARAFVPEPDMPADEATDSPEVTKENAQKLYDKIPAKDAKARAEFREKYAVELGIK